MKATRIGDDHIRVFLALRRLAKREPNARSPTRQTASISTSSSARHELRAFPEAARREAGHQLDQVQRGLEPDNWKPMPGVGGGVREMRIRDQAGAFRVIYTATRPEAVYVLHAFQKKTQATAKRDLELAEARFRELTRSKP